MENKFYIAGSLNSAFSFQGERIELYNKRLSNSSSVFLDRHLLSQVYAANPEIKEVAVRNTAELERHLELEGKKQEALSIALELMDRNFSDEYKSEVFDILKDLCLESNVIYQFVLYRLHTTLLPKEFSPESAISICKNKSTLLFDLYFGLKERLRYFSLFYTAFVFTANLEKHDLESVDALLTDNGYYYDMIFAIKNLSEVRFGEIASKMKLSIEKIEVAVDDKLFEQIKKQLAISHKLLFTAKRKPGETNGKQLLYIVMEIVVFIIENHENAKQVKLDLSEMLSVQKTYARIGQEEFIAEEFCKKSFKEISILLCAGKNLDTALLISYVAAHLADNGEYEASSTLAGLIALLNPVVNPYLQYQQNYIRQSNNSKFNSEETLSKRQSAELHPKKERKPIAPQKEGKGHSSEYQSESNDPERLQWSPRPAAKTNLKDTGLSYDQRYAAVASTTLAIDYGRYETNDQEPIDKIIAEDINFYNAIKEELDKIHLNPKPGTIENILNHSKNLI